MIPFANNLWLWEQEQAFYGLELGTRMTVIRLTGDALLVLSPIRLTEDIIDDLNILGEVKYVICPNKFHHLYAADFKKQYPQAKIYCAPGLEKKREDISFDGVITNAQTFPWNPEVEHVVIDGIPMINEVVFFHPLSQTMIITDLALHMRDVSSFKTRMILKLIGAYDRFGLSRLEKWAFIKNTKRFQESLKPLFAWNIERIALAHGTLIEDNGKQRFFEAFKDYKA